MFYVTITNVERLVNHTPSKKSRQDTAWVFITCQEGIL